MGLKLFFFFETTREVSTPACHSGLTKLPASSLPLGGRGVHAGSWHTLHEWGFSLVADTHLGWFMHGFLLLISSDILAVVIWVWLRS